METRAILRNSDCFFSIVFKEEEKGMKVREEEL